MHNIFISLGVLLAVVGAVVAWVFARCAGMNADAADFSAQGAQESWRSAQASEVRLKVLRSDVSALAATVQALEHRLNRVQGRVYAQPRRDDIAGALQASDDPRARIVGEAHERLGVGIAAPSARACSCGWCETCTRGPLGAVNGSA